MKIISFDVGIKNMAYCLFEITENTSTQQCKIVDWKVLSLLKQEEPTNLCGCLKKAKSNGPKETCNKKAKYTTIQTQDPIQIFLCDKHAKEMCKPTEKYLLPQPRFKTVKKMNMEGLLELAKELGITELPKKKGDIIVSINDYLKRWVLNPIVKHQQKAGEADLISLGQSMKTIFRSLVEEHPDLSVVLIENQISPLASRMKTVQGMLAQYFIMMYESIQIEFISSANKLKMFSKEPKESKDKTQSQKYNEHKKDGIFYCEQVLKEGGFEGGEQWTQIEKKKKDDLADCFLQGVWWLKHTKQIQ
jgi:hypothetical protein